MRSFVNALLVDNLFVDEEEKKRIFVCYLIYANKLLIHASNSDDIALCKSNLSFIKDVSVKLNLNELNEEINRYQFSIDLKKLLAIKSVSEVWI
jgi:hypothetical protein